MLKIPNFSNSLDVQAKLTFWVIFCFASSILLYLSIFNLAGQFGNLVGAFLATLLGRGAFILPIFFIISGAILIKLQKSQKSAEEFNGRLVWGILFMILAFNGLLSVIFQVENPSEVQLGGGIVGYFMYPLIFGFFGAIGGVLLLICLWMFGFFLISQMTAADFVDTIQASLQNPNKFWDLVPDIFEIGKTKALIEEKKEDKKSTENIASRQAKLDPKANLNSKTTEYASLNEPSSVTNLDSEIPPKAVSLFEKLDEQNQADISDLLVEEQKTEAEKLLGKLGVGDIPPSPFQGGGRKADGGLQKGNSVVSKTTTSIPKKPLRWVLPAFDILFENKEEGKVEIDVEANKETIKKTFSSFGIEVEMGKAVVGPTVTQYTFRPASGVKISSINALQKDLALALAATSMRMELPIAGQSLVGLEIPNAKKSQVRLRDILQTDEFVTFQGPLPVAVGKNVAGANVIFSIAKMPHLLVAGATGAGKSVWINSMLLSLLYRYSPADLQLILVDMKRVELKLYEKVPHLLANVITDANQAINALKWTVLEMDRRYRLLEKFGKRNIKDYNSFAAEANIELLPYTVFVIDELGDLMMLAKHEVEPIIVRLTQMSRAVGIHLVLGTQRPDVQVVTGLIKANVPSRIAFAVVSQIDSRVILDAMGAEKLLGQGDGLFMSPSSMQPMRFQGPNVEESEVRDCVEFLKIQAAKNDGITNLRPEVTEPPEVEISVPGMAKAKSKVESRKLKGDDGILLYEQAKKLVINYQECSLDFLIQVLDVDKKTADRIMDQLEDDEIIGPALPGSKNRDVYG